MKNLLVFLGPEKKFNEECSILVKIQIDNSLDLGWNIEDILLVTNFPYEYNGVKAIVVGDENFCAVRPRSIKTAIIPHLIDLGIVKKGEIYWNHDLEAFELNRIKESELGLEDVDMGLTDYGWREMWCMGSFFFKESARDIFELAKEMIFRNIEDETVILRLERNNVNNINSRYKRLNITYNLGARNVPSNFEKATKPLKVVHFHPDRRGLMDVFTPIMNERLINIFKKHKII